MKPVNKTSQTFPAQSDETRIFIEAYIETFLRPKFLRPLLGLFFRINIFDPDAKIFLRDQKSELARKWEFFIPFFETEAKKFFGTESFDTDCDGVALWFLVWLRWRTMYYQVVTCAEQNIAKGTTNAGVNCFTQYFGLDWWSWFGRYGSVSLVVWVCFAWQLWFGRFGLVGLV